MNSEDVPSPIDLKDIHDAREWERTAMQRPFREAFFSEFSRELSSLYKPGLRLLELGSGPGFLAHHILCKHPDFDYTLLDFSSAMHELARCRLSEHNPNHLTFIECSFKDPGWEQGLGKFDAIVTNQAVHELRHKKHALAFFKEVKTLLAPGGIFLFCDHYFGEDAMKNEQLYMSLIEQHQALESAGFTVREVLIKGGRALYRAT